MKLFKFSALSLLLALLASLAADAQVKINALPAGSAISGTDLAICDQSNVTKACTYSQVATYVGSHLPASPTFTSILLTGGINGLSLPGGNNQSVSVGNGAGAAVTTAVNNVFIGYNAGNAATTCNQGAAGLGYDVAIGWQALPLDNGCENTALGVNTLLFNTTGSFNVAIGNDAETWLQTANSNIGIGHSACAGGGSSTTYLTGSVNTCVGDSAGAFLNGAAANNVFVGGNAGIGANANKNTASSNVAVGWNALNAVSTAGSNVAVGFAAMQGSAGAPLTVGQNVAIGAGALQTAQGANSFFNTAVGYNALTALNGATTNTAVGNIAGSGIVAGSNNTLLGYGAGLTIAGGGHNVVIGAAVASTVLTSGSNNVLIGTTNNITTAAAATSNTIQIGAGSTAVWGATGTGTPSTATSTLAGAYQMPNLAASSAATTGTVCWTTATGNLTVDTTTTCLLSDGRHKMNVEPLEAGISEVMKLKPVSYDLKPEVNPTHLGRQIGLIAQDVVKVDPRLAAVYPSGPDKDTPSGVRYEQMVALLVKAIQEQQSEISDLKRQMSAH